MSIYGSTNVWFGKGYVVSSDPVGDGRHFNRDDYGIWFTILCLSKMSFGNQFEHSAEQFFSSAGSSSVSFSQFSSVEIQFVTAISVKTA